MAWRYAAARENCPRHIEHYGASWVDVLIRARTGHVACGAFVVVLLGPRPQLGPFSLDGVSDPYPSLFHRKYAHSLALAEPFGSRADQAMIVLGLRRSPAAPHYRVTSAVAAIGVDCGLTCAHSDAKSSALAPPYTLRSMP